MIGEVLKCAREECSAAFTKATHNQKYCSNDCCRIETNRKIMEKYHERAAIRRGKKRLCDECETPLSRYNTDSICGACQTGKRKEDTGKAFDMVNSVVWL